MTDNSCVRTLWTGAAAVLDGYLTVDQACKLAAISRSTFNRLLDDPDSGPAEGPFGFPG